MKRMFTIAAVAGGLALGATAANAATSAECEAYARAQAEAAYPTGAGAVGGGILGAIVGGGIAGATGGNVGTGVAAGGLGGAVLGGTANTSRRQQVFNQAYWNCMNSGGQAAPAPAPSGPVPTPASWGSPPSPQAFPSVALNVRFGPGVNYGVSWVVQPNEPVGVGACSSSWCAVNGSGGQGYASRSYLNFY